MKKIFLQKNKEKSLLRFHPWVFSGAVAQKSTDISEGEVVEVYDSHKNYLATGHFSDSSICVRVFSFTQIEPTYSFWKQKVEDAVAFRNAISLINNDLTNMFRLINGEGDGLPGLIIDWFNGNVVFQFHSYGMFLLKDTFVKIMLELFSNRIKSIYNKSVSVSNSSIPIQADEMLYGEFDDLLVKENGTAFYIDVVGGQKTGFFIDQRNNRKLVGEYAKNKNVLNLFCYTGGFSAYALKGGANIVHSVDISKKAIELTEQNMAINKPFADKHTAYVANVFEFMDDIPDHFYDLIVLDPPAFAKHHKVKEQGIKGYRKINKKAMEKIKPGGFLFTFSCSQAIDNEEFKTIVFSAAAIANKNVRMVKQLHQAEDHPISIYHPEGEYLKGFMLEIND